MLDTQFYRFKRNFKQPERSPRTLPSHGYIHPFPLCRFQIPPVGAIDVLMGMHEAAVSHKGRGAPLDILSSRGMV